ncbi:MAG: 2,3-butanediol dehydrogenase [Streptococcaceae bacterium]|jgi:(R,R)-butanediol dehydrogenase/meso-butanediol dehydrogenase/diacetyl reductase|nr:2,3-butanediol dehydrogenase [Streptococcaceae bacterium]
MKAAVWYAQKDVRVEEVEVKPCDVNEVRVKVAFTGMCGSDLHEYLEGPIFTPTETPNEFTGKIAPIVMGHEFSGVIDEIGSKVKNLRVGDRVAIYPTLSHEKKAEAVDIYDGYNFIGFARDGGFAQYCTLPATSVYQIPDNMSFEQGALVEPTAVAVQACKEGSVKFGDKVAIFGAGPIGCLITAAAKAAGAVEIIVCDLSEERLEKAKELGATIVLNSAKVNVVETIRDLTHGGVDVAFEVAGVAITVQQSIAATRARGMMVIVSIFAHEISWNPMQLVNSGVKITSTIAYTRTTFEQTIEAIGNGQLVVDPVITQKITLDEIIEGGFERLTTDKTQAKILVDVQRIN